MVFVLESGLAAVLLVVLKSLVAPIKKITVSGAGGKNQTASCRAKLNELLEFIKMDVMKEPQTGIALGVEAWTKGEFHLTDEQMAQLKEQAERFGEFVSRQC